MSENPTKSDYYRYNYDKCKLPRAGWTDCFLQLSPAGLGWLLLAQICRRGSCQIDPRRPEPISACTIFLDSANGRRLYVTFDGVIGNWPLEAVKATSRNRGLPIPVSLVIVSHLAYFSI